MDILIRLVIGFLALGLVLYTLEWRFPVHRQQKILRAGFGTDLIYWFFTPLVTRSITRFATILVLVPLGLLLGREIGPGLAAGAGPIARQPFWAIALEMLVLGDLIGYWLHRWFHQGRMWRFHAVHHGSEQLDWLAAVRVHPVNDLVMKVGQASVLLCLGFPLTALAAYVPFLSFYALLLHANVGWSFGPLRHVLASPAFHRWHHTGEKAGLNKNFAGLLPVWDLLFGSFYMPDRAPAKFGIRDGDMPKGFWGQLAYPFRRLRAKPSTGKVLKETG